MKLLHATFAGACALMLCGCFTLHETEPVNVQLSKAPKGTDVKIALAAGTGNNMPGLTYPSELVIAKGTTEATGTLTVDTDALTPEVKYTAAIAASLGTSPADYNVDVTFEGPFISDDERSVEWAWMLCSVLSAEYSVQTWTARLRIYDNKTGRVVFTQDYAQRYQNVVWSPLFFIGLSGYTRNTFNYMQCWCLTALTDRAMADATAFLTAGKSK